jgi:SAM-dependent methyltransferase
MAESELSGDVQLSFDDRLRYLWRNACRNASQLGRGPATRPFHPDLQRARDAITGQSPGRLVTEQFLETELPKLLPAGRIEVLEIGCGRGALPHRLAKIGYSGRYTGVDVQDQFVRNHSGGFPIEVSFVQIDAHQFTPDRPVDLLFSHSTLEHIPRDGELIARFPAFLKAGGLDLHAVPSGASLVPYLWHGFRQYTPSSLVVRFGPSIEIVRLGGLGSFVLHVIFITVPEIFFRCSLRKRLPGLYRALMTAALRLDRIVPIFPTAYAVIRRG